MRDGEVFRTASPHNKGADLAWPAPPSTSSLARVLGDDLRGLHQKGCCAQRDQSESGGEADHFSHLVNSLVFVFQPYAFEMRPMFWLDARRRDFFHASREIFFAQSKSADPFEPALSADQLMGGSGDDLRSLRERDERDRREQNQRGDESSGFCGGGVSENFGHLISP